MTSIVVFLLLGLVIVHAYNGNGNANLRKHERERLKYLGEKFSKVLDDVNQCKDQLTLRECEKYKRQDTNKNRILEHEEIESYKNKIKNRLTFHRDLVRNRTIQERKSNSQNFRKSPLRQQSNRNIRTRMTQQENKKIRILQKVLDQLKTCQSKDSDDFCDEKIAELFNKIGLKNDDEGFREMEFKIFNELKKLRNNQRKKTALSSNHRGRRNRIMV